MKKNIRLILLSHFLLFSFSQFLSAQCPVQNTAFQDGERLEYKLFFNWKFIWKTAGSASMTTKMTTYQGKSAFQTDLITRTSGRIDKWFCMRDTLRSIFTPQVVPLFYRKGANEGGKYRVNEITYKYSGGQAQLHQRYRHASPRLTTVRLNVPTIWLAWSCVAVVTKPVTSPSANAYLSNLLTATG